MSIKYIFCISTGRSGTAYLSKLLGQLDNCSAYHEQKPVLHNEIMRGYLDGDKAALKKEFTKKLEYIRRNQNAVYADTSHIFIKSFGWELPNHIPQNEIGVIILKRDKEKVVQSTQRVHSGPFTYLGKKWILIPYKNAIIKPPVNYYIFHSYRYMLKLFWMFKDETNSIVKTYPHFFKNKSIQLIDWYYDEIYALGAKFKKTFPEISYVDVDLEELNSIEGFEKIIQTFKLNEYYNKEAVESVIGTVANLKSEF